MHHHPKVLVGKEIFRYLLGTHLYNLFANGIHYINSHFMSPYNTIFWCFFISFSFVFFIFIIKRIFFGIMYIIGYATGASMAIILNIYDLFKNKIQEIRTHKIN